MFVCLFCIAKVNVRNVIILFLKAVYSKHDVNLFLTKYVRMSNKTPLYFLCLFQLYYHLHVLNKQVHLQEVISVHAVYRNFHVCMCVMSGH